MLYESLVGAWPLGLSAEDREGVAALEERLAAWQEKALREGKRHTGWAEPNAEYEAACRDFLHQVMDPDRVSRVLQDIAAFVERIAAPGAVNALSQVLLRITSPGVPDLYQGTEYWDFSLVDPDNRRPVDFPAREASLAAAQDPAALLAEWKDGRVKQAVVARALQFRAASEGLFTEGSYVPLKAEGERADNVLAFARVLEGRASVTVVARLPAQLPGIGAQPMPDATGWGATFLNMPRNLVGRRVKDVLAGEEGGEAAEQMLLSNILAKLPVGLLEIR